MKRFPICLSALFVISVMFVACNEDEKTELGWINDSAGSINEIVWADHDADWVKTGGYAVNEQTESKEVNETTGDVECSLEVTPGDFQPVNVDLNIPGGGNTLSLEKGESYVYEIQAAKK